MNHTVSIAYQFHQSMRRLEEVIGCMRRAADCPQLVTQANFQTWRWLCLVRGV